MQKLYYKSCHQFVTRILTLVDWAERGANPESSRARSLAVQPLDPTTLLVAATLLLITLLVGHLFPVIRALRVDPATVLWGE
jgi:hypothetical protein